MPVRWAWSHGGDKTKIRKINRPWPKSNQFWRWSGYIIIRFPENAWKPKFDLFYLKVKMPPKWGKSTDHGWNLTRRVNSTSTSKFTPVTVQSSWFFTLVIKRSDLHPFCLMPIGPPIHKTRLFQNLTMNVKAMSVVKVKATLLADSNHSLLQYPNEPLQQYVAKLQAKAAYLYSFNTTCKCSKTVSYAESMVMDQMPHGLWEKTFRVKSWSKIPSWKHLVHGMTASMPLKRVSIQEPL